MPRIRSIKPEFFTSLTIADLSLETRLTFIGLWTYANDHGKANADPRLVKAAIWPLDDRTSEEISRDLRELEERGLIYTYDDGRGRGVFHICSWEEHQRVSHPKKDDIPDCPRCKGAGQEGSPETLRKSSRDFPEDVGKPHESFGPEQGAGNREGDSRGPRERHRRPARGARCCCC